MGPRKTSSDDWQCAGPVDHGLLDLAKHCTSRDGGREGGVGREALGRNGHYGFVPLEKILVRSHVSPPFDPNVVLGVVAATAVLAHIECTHG